MNNNERKIKKKIGNHQRKKKKNLEVKGKLRIFASSNMSFDYPGRIPRGVRLYRYCPILKSHRTIMALYFCLYFIMKFLM